MKKYLLTVCIVGIAIGSSIAQEFNPIKIGAGFGYASPGGEGAQGGILAYFEPAYRVTDEIAVGFRLEAAVMARSVVVEVAGVSTVAEAEVKANASYTINGQYYFLNGSFRPFAGLGLGIYSLASESATVSGTNASVSASASTSKFGFYPRVGFDLGHLVLQVEYNIIPSSKADVEITVGTSTTVVTSEAKNSYLGIKLGFFFLGGKK